MDKILPCKVMYNKFHILIYYKVDWSQQFPLKTFWCVKWISYNFCGLLCHIFLTLVIACLYGKHYREGKSRKLFLRKIFIHYEEWKDRYIQKCSKSSLCYIRWVTILYSQTPCNLYVLQFQYILVGFACLFVLIKTWTNVWVLVFSNPLFFLKF